MKDGPQSIYWLFFSLKGRIRRVTYALAAFLLVLLQGYCFLRVGFSEADSPDQTFWLAAFFAAFLASIWSVIALSVKRLHDIGYSGRYGLALLIPGITEMAFFALCAWPGEASDNEYGSPPVVEN